MEKRFKNAVGATAPHVQGTLQETLGTYARSFGFKKADEVVREGALVSFGFMTLAGTRVDGAVEVTPELGLLTYEWEPADAQFIKIVTDGIEKAVGKVFSGE